MLPATANAQCQSKNTFAVEKTDPTPVVFRAADINLRAGPGLGFCLVRVLKQAKDKPAAIIARAGTWRQISFEDKTYWIHFMLLKYINLYALRLNEHLKRLS